MEEFFNKIWSKKTYDKFLWKTLNDLRKGKGVLEIKDLFISILFLKYANDFFVSDSLSKVIVPENADWNKLMESSNKSFFLHELLSALLSIENSNSHLSNTFSCFKFDLSDKSLSVFASELFQTIDVCNFAEEDYDFLEITESLILNFAKYEGKVGDDHTTPQSVSDLMVKLLNPVGGTMLDSTCGIGSFFKRTINLCPNAKFQFFGQECDFSTLALAKLSFAFIENNEVQFAEANDSLENDCFKELKADYVIMHPPFDLRNWITENSINDPRFKFGLSSRSNSGLAWLQHALFHLNDNGKAAIVLNNGVLSSQGRDGEIKRLMIEADLVESIIALPSQLMANTTIPVCLWLLNNNKKNTNEVLFVDASNFGSVLDKSIRNLKKAEINQIVSSFLNWQNNQSNYNDVIGFSKTTSLNEIRKNNFILSPNRYVGSEILTEIDLSKAVELGKIISFKNLVSAEINTLCYKLTVKDLASNPDKYMLNDENLEEIVLNRGFKFLEDNTLLLAKIGPNLKPTYFNSSKKKIALTNIYAFYVDQTKISIDYLIAELHKEYVTEQIKLLSTGVSFKSISVRDLLKIKISVPELLSQQQKIVKRERKIRFSVLAKESGFEREFFQFKQNQLKDLGAKKHNIMQHLNNVKASADVLVKIMELSGGVLHSDKIIDPKRGVTVEKRFLRLQESLSKVIYYVDNITNELEYDNSEIINPINFLKDCKERGVQNQLFSIEIIVENSTFEGREPLISISKNDFEEIYNNILENAIKHGFVDKSKSYIFRISIAYIDDNVEIYFVNNGKPFPKGISDKIEVKGEKAGETGGTGIGLWKVAEIAKHFNSNLEVYDEPNSEFPVGFKFKFNLETL